MRVGWGEGGWEGEREIHLQVWEGTDVRTRNPIPPSKGCHLQGGLQTDYTAELKRPSAHTSHSGPQEAGCTGISLALKDYLDYLAARKAHPGITRLAQSARTEVSAGFICPTSQGLLHPTNTT